MKLITLSTLLLIIFIVSIAFITILYQWNSFSFISLSSISDKHKEITSAIYSTLSSPISKTSINNDIPQIPLREKIPKEFSIGFEAKSRVNDNIVYKGMLSVKQTGNSLGESEIYMKSKLLSNTQQEETLYYKNNKLIQKTHINANGFQDDIIECISADHVPPMVHLLKLLETNTKYLGRNRIIESESNRPIFDKFINGLFKQDNKYYNDDKWIVFYEGEHYIIVEKDGNLKLIVGKEFMFHVKEYKTFIYPFEKNFKVSLFEKCQRRGESNIKVEIQEQITPYFEDPKICDLDWLKDEQTCSNLARASPEGKVCIFLHGVGETEDFAVTSEFPGYWGNINKYTPQCSERHFLQTETKLRGWDDKELQKQYCEVALTGQKDTTIVKNKVLFIHSMGNMVMAAAIKNKICDIDKETTSWYNLQGPLSGSKAADMLNGICLENLDGYKKKLYHYVAVNGGYCKPNSSIPYPAYETLRPSYPGVDELGDIARRYTTGALCGVSAKGLNSLYSLPLYFLSKIVGYEDSNDGMVPIDSCTSGIKGNLTDSYTDNFYFSGINHADGTCRDGDAWWGNTKPCSYYSNKY